MKPDRTMQAGIGLFLDPPRELEKRIDRLIAHFRHAEYLFFSKNERGLPTPSELMWLLICDVMQTVTAMPDKERRAVSRIGSINPATRITINEAFAVELSRRNDGMPAHDEKTVRHTVHEAAVDRMVDVLDLMRFVGGKDAVRMKRLVMARARGASMEQCGRIWDRHRVGFDRRAFHDIKTRVIGQIFKGIEEHFGLVRTSRGFRRLTMREIEQRRKRNEREAEADAC